MSNINRRYKLLIIISYLMKISLIIAIIGSILKQQYNVLFFASLTLILGIIPSLIEKNHKIILPLEFELMLSIFIFATLFLGEAGDYYDKYWWWDVMLHTFSGAIIGLLGFLIVYIFNSQKKIHLHLTPIFLAVFSFSFAVSIGAVWEIFEYSMDTLFGLNMQRSSLVDTMWDLIVDSIGALCISIMGYFYTKKVKVPIFDSLMNIFKYKNPHIFKENNKNEEKKVKNIELK